MAGQGLFIVLEGSDGSGKTTQLNLLKERLQATGYDVAVFDFPRYDKQSSYFIQQYLNGQYGRASSISPYTASLFYALDRYEAANDIRQAINDGKVVLCNRYVGSNMAHQGSKLNNLAEQRGFFVWEDNLEFELLKIPRPNINIFLRVPADVSYNLIAKKLKRSYTGKVRDEHEADMDHLKQAVATYDLLCSLFPKDFKAIECSKNGEILSIPEINNKIWQYIQPMLPPEKPNPSHSVVVTLGLEKAEPQLQPQSNKNSISIPFKNASLLLRLQMERARPGSVYPNISDISTRRYDFYTPNILPHNLAQAYKESLRSIISKQISISDKMAAYLDRYQSAPKESRESNQAAAIKLVLPLTPLALLTEFELNIGKSDVVSIASKLLADDSDEVTWAAKQLYIFARQNWPKEFMAPLESNSGPESLNNIIAKLADERLPLNSSSDETVKLLEASPRQEFDLLAESIYPFSSLSLAEIREEVSDWPYQQKYDGLKQALLQPGIGSKVIYKMDIISDQITLNELASLTELKNVPVQYLTPRYGYEVPQIIEQAGLDDLYNDCFDESLKIYSILQAAGQDDTAAYVTLLGHKTRWQFNTDAMHIKSALLSDAKPADYRTSSAILEKLAEVHPLTWDILSNSSVELPTPPKNGRNRVKPAHQPAKRKPRSKK